jgi:isoquinoline 1-oxidoreductase beta subunit
MRDDATHPTAEPRDGDPATALPLRRRQVLAYALSAPVATVAAGIGGNLALAGAAQAALPLTPPDTVDYYDLGDASLQVSLPTMPLVRLSVGTDNRVKLELPRMESGQGIDTAAGMMVAEELGVPLSQVDVTLSDARPELLFNQLTGGSTNVRVLDAAMPVMAAALRLRLLAAAAQRWGVATGSLSVRAGVVVSSDGRSAAFGTLTAAAALLPVPAGVLPKPVAQNTVVGQRLGRIDARAIVTGQKKFTLDQNVPGAVPTMVRRPPTVLGTVVTVNNAAAVRAMPGVIAVVVIPAGGTITPTPPGVAVMAETFGQAWTAVNALDVTWGAGTVDGQSNDTVHAKLAASVLPLVVPPLGALTIEGEFQMAPLSHAPMETDCAIADVRRDAAGTITGCEIWAGLQSPIVAQQDMALLLGLPTSAVKVHVVSSGGSFGRRLFWDPVQQAVQVSKLTGKPCKLMYHRADDMRHGRGRPQQYHRARATVLLGQVVAFEHRIASPRLDTRHGLGDFFTAAAASGGMPAVVQQSVGNLAVEQALFKTMVAAPYNFGVATRTLQPAPIVMNTGSYRSVHIQPTRMVEEILVDEIAAALKKDAVAFRLETLRQPRARAVLQTVATAAGWGKAMPAGFGQGIAVHQETRSYIAVCVEIDARAQIAGTGPAVVTRATIAVDVGKVINLSGVEAQVQGALAESISIVLMAGLHLNNGLPLEGSYSQYHYGRNKHYPKDVRVIVVPNQGDPIGGLGEVGMAGCSGAIANAWARATGQKPRKFPLYFPVDFAPFPSGKLPNPVVNPIPA